MPLEWAIIPATTGVAIGEIMLCVRRGEGGLHPVSP